MEQIINFKGTEYIIGEPTVTEWQKISLAQEFKHTDDFYLELISIATGLSTEDLKDVSMVEILNVISGLSEYYTNLDTQFHNKFVFNETEYSFVNLNEISFGHFADLDTFTSNNENYRSQNLNRFLALLYVPKGEHYFKNLESRREEFKELPVRYFLGAQGFFLRLEQILHPGMKGYSFLLLIITLKIRIMKKLRRVFRNIGVGMGRCLRWPKTLLQRLTR